MKFFTPDLYIRINSSNDREVSAAMAEWERTITRYARHIKKIAASFPERLRYFSNHCCLHDADVFGPTWLSAQTVPWSFDNVSIMAQNINTLEAEHLGTLMVLQYSVVADPEIETHETNHPFETGQPIWLYDELDVIEPEVFSHEILVSDGRVIKLRFREFQLHIGKLVEPGQLELKRQAILTTRAKKASA